MCFGLVYVWLSEGMPLKGYNKLKQLWKTLAIVFYFMQMPEEISR